MEKETIFKQIQKIQKELKECPLLDNNIYYLLNSGEFIFRDKILSLELSTALLVFDYIKLENKNIKHQGVSAYKYTINNN